MKEQPEALTFPELLETVPNDAYLTIPNETGREVRIIPVGRYCHNAADELRRLSAENERLAAEVANRNRRALAGDEAVAALANVHAHYECLEAQRDALLEALRGLLSYANVLEMRLLDADGEHRAMQQARAAIAKAEGENHAKNL